MLLYSTLHSTLSIIYCFLFIYFRVYCFTASVFCNTVYIKKTLLTKDFVCFIYFYQPQNMLPIFFSVSEYAYNMLRFFRNFSLNMLKVVMLIKKGCNFESFLKTGTTFAVLSTEGKTLVIKERLNKSAKVYYLGQKP